MSSSDPNKVIDVTKAVQDVILRIYRWDSSGTWGEDGRLVDYTVPVPPGMTVLDGLIWIKANLDHTLSARGVPDGRVRFLRDVHPRQAAAGPARPRS